MDEPVGPPQLPPPNPEKLGADGTLTRKQKRYIAGGVMVALSVLVVASIAHKPDTPAVKPKPKPVQTMATTMPSAPVMASPGGAGVTPDPMPAIQPVSPNAYPGASYASGDGQRPEKSLKEQMRDERAQLLAKSAFDDNVVSSPHAFSNAAVLEPGAGTTSSTGGTAPQASDPASAVIKKTDLLDFQPTFILPEGTIINCALVNEINGEFSGPVVVQVSTAVYAPGTRIVVIPQGTRIIGEANKVGAFGQQRLAVTFHRMLVPTPTGPYSVSLDKTTPGLDQVGATALHDKVDSHYISIFGASLAIGAIGGLAQIGNNYGANGYSSMGQFRNGVSESMAQSSERVLDRFLNRTPTLTIRPGTRVLVFLTQDLQVPAYETIH